jgi:hypothetical protein
MLAMKSAVVAALVVVVLAGSAVLPVGAQSGTEVIAMHVAGMAQSEPTEPGRVAYTVNVFNITTGERLGTLHDEITCSSTAPPPCLVFDVVTTLRLRGGEITNRAQWSGVPDPQRPGFLLVGSRPGAKTASGTAGDYDNRAAHWAGSGTVDVRRFPAQFGYDIFSVVTVDVARS